MHYAILELDTNDSRYFSFVTTQKYAFLVNGTTFNPLLYVTLGFLLLNQNFKIFFEL